MLMLLLMTFGLTCIGESDSGCVRVKVKIHLVPVEAPERILCVPVVGNDETLVAWNCAITVVFTTTNNNNNNNKNIANNINFIIIT